MVADVSDQKRAELALRESEVRFRSLVQNSSDMVTIIGADGQVDVSQPERVAIPRPRSGDDPDVPVDFGLFEEDRPAVGGDVRSGCGRNPGASETIRYRFRRADGELRWIEMVATDHSDDPAVLGVVTNARDITDRVEAESTVRASEERLSAARRQHLRRRSR